MRKRMSQLLCLILVIALAGSLSVTAFAAETTGTLFTLSVPTDAAEGYEAVVLINVTEANKVTDAHISVTYDSSRLTFSRAEVGGAWSNVENARVAANTRGDDTVDVAFAGVDAARVGDVVKLIFIARVSGSASVAFDSKGAQVTGVENPTFGEGKSFYIEPTYRLMVVGGSGSGWYRAGTAVTVTANTGMGIFESWTATGIELADPTAREFTLTMPANDVTITANWSAVSKTFTDVSYPADSEYSRAIEFVVGAGLMSGTSETTFSPGAKMTRGMMVTVLYRLAGEPTVTGENPFTDVDEAAYYRNAVVWAFNNGVTKGVSATSFAPSKELTRQEIATFLYRYAELYRLDGGDRDGLTDYTDASSVSSWAREAMEWAVGNGIVRGTTSDTLSSKADATRIQVAIMLCRFVEA